MPPGTGDVTLTVFQSLPLSGIVVVGTPQGLVNMIVSKAVKMARMMNVPLLGYVENMSYLKCPECGHDTALFGPSRADAVAAEFGFPCAVRLPLDPVRAAACDEGRVECIREEALEPLLRRLEALPEKRNKKAALNARISREDLYVFGFKQTGRNDWRFPNLKN